MIAVLGIGLVVVISAIVCSPKQANIETPQSTPLPLYQPSALWQDVKSGKLQPPTKVIVTFRIRPVCVDGDITYQYHPGYPTDRVKSILRFRLVEIVFAWQKIDRIEGEVIGMLDNVVEMRNCRRIVE